MSYVNFVIDKGNGKAFRELYNNKNGDTNVPASILMIVKVI